MERLINAIKEQAAMMAAGQAMPRLGLVSSYDPDKYAAKVRVMPEDVETGWLPVASPWIGNSWGLFAPPTPGDQVVVLFEGGSLDAGVVIGRLYSNQQRPLGAVPGEFWLIHQSGSALKFNNDGTVDLTTSGDLNVTAGGNIVSQATVWNHTGPINVDGDLTATGTVTGDTEIVSGGDVIMFSGLGSQFSMSNFRLTYNGHTHVDPQGGSTSAPTQTI